MENVYSQTNICPSGNATITSNLTGSTYQWQLNVGTGFQNLSASSNYTGTNTRNLQLAYAPTTWTGHQYRCLVNGTTYSDTTTLRFTNTWTGSVSTAWETANNWSCTKVPDKYTDVIINSGTVVLNSNRQARTVSLNPSASLTINTNYNLYLTNSNNPTPGGIIAYQTSDYFACSDLYNGAYYTSYTYSQDYYPAIGAPTISGDTIFWYERQAYNSPGTLFAFTKSGGLIWSALPYNGLKRIVANTCLTYYKGVLYADIDDGTIAAIDSRNGNILWTYQWTTQTALQAGPTPVVQNDKIFFYWCGAFALDLNGHELWKRTDISCGGIMNQRPLAANNMMIFSSGSTSIVYALDQVTGNTIWTSDLHIYYNDPGCYSSPVLVNGLVLVGHNGMKALDVNTGTVVWTNNLYPDNASIALGNGFIYFTNSNSNPAKIIAIDAVSGDFRWQTTINSSISNLVVARDRMYVAINNTIFSLDAYNGDYLYSWGASYMFGGFSIYDGGTNFYPHFHGNFQ